MFNQLSWLFSANGFIPHGYCISWSQPLLWTFAISDIVIFLSYASMPVALAYFAHRRKDFPYRWLLWMFAIFILACGATHLLDAIVLWEPMYDLLALLKVLTAVVSLITAITLWPLMPYALKLPSPELLREKNDELQREINERKRIQEELSLAKQAAEEGLQHERSLMAAIVEYSDDAIVAMTLDGILTSWNKGAEKIFCYSAQEMLGKSIDQLVPLDRQGEDQKELAAIRLGESIEHFETQRLRKDGKRIDISVTVSPIYDNYGQIIGASKIARDITEQKISSEQIRKLSLAVEQSPESIAITNLDAELEYVNSAFIKNTGYSKEEVIGKNPRVLQSGKTSGSTYSAMWQALTKGEVWKGELYNKRKDGSEYIELATISPVRDESGKVTHYLALKEDITNKKAAEEKTLHLAYYDHLTDLPNRRLLLDRLSQALILSERSKQFGSILYIDLDHFKDLNDTQGHDAGDEFLKQVSARLLACVRESDTVARVGGDEFVVMLEDLHENLSIAASFAKSVANKILAVFDLPFNINGHSYTSTPSIGISLFSSHRHDTVEEIFKRADMAMYDAKSSGRNTVKFFDQTMQLALAARTQLELDLRTALKQGLFCLYYQAQVDAQGCTIGAEALLRLQHPKDGLLAPGCFIKVAEETGLIVPIGNWVLESACNQLAQWATKPATAGMILSVNVSARQFSNVNFIEQVLSILKRTGANPNLLKLEPTESILLEDVQGTIEKMTVLRNNGVRFALDDFGTGYSSLAYLKKLPLDQLKIDQSFVSELPFDSNACSIVKAVINMANSLNLGIIAEGVETIEQRNYLFENGCYLYQGYFFSHPMPLEQFNQFLSDNRDKGV